MKKLIRMLLIAMITSSGFSLNLLSQIPASGDGNWELNISKSDEFNGNSVNTELWYILDKPDFPWGANHCWCEDQVTVNNGYLHLEVLRKLPYSDPLCCYTWVPFYSGGIRSQSSDYSYGYYEISAKLPGAYINGYPDGEGFWPAFWTYYIAELNGCRVIHDEIDILEPSGSQYATANTNVAGWHDEIGNCNKEKKGEVWYNHYQPLFLQNHKYAAEWLPDRIIFYFDDEPIYTSFNQPGFIMRPQFVVIDQQMDYYSSVNPNMPFPQYMSVDYFRYYQINTSFCNLDAIILTNTVLNNFAYGIRNK